MQGLIDRQQWNNFLKDFNKRNALRASRLEILGDEIGAQEEERHLPLSGVSLEEKGDGAPRVEISLGGETAKDERHITHTMSHVRSIMTKVGVDLREEALLIADEEGNKTILLFDELPELAE